MKTLQVLAAQVGGSVVNLRFRSNGKFQKGYAIIDADKNELLTCEPCYYSNGDRWLVHNRCEGGLKGVYYVSDLRKLKTQQIKPGFTGYKFG